MRVTGQNSGNITEPLMINENQDVCQPTNKAESVEDDPSNIMENVVENTVPTTALAEETESTSIPEEEKSVKMESPVVDERCSQCADGQLCFQCGNQNGK